MSSSSGSTTLAPTFIV
uniref:Uncharacterized protein n=1 Tax=Anguilla anguilla TaxID=7936 RepID=A0A0E9QS12_ANGAN